MYVPTNWENGDVITADKLNNIETGVNGLQTQVNNSAVGTNLLLGTSKTLTTVTNAAGYIDNIPPYLVSEATVNSDASYTIRAWISLASHDMNAQVVWTDSSGILRHGVGNAVSAGTSGYSTWTGTITAGSIIQRAAIAFVSPQGPSSVSYCEAKLEKGSVATDWCPNPSEILTQSDYAKIKAAIVALGGSLS